MQIRGCIMSLRARSMASSESSAAYRLSDARIALSLAVSPAFHCPVMSFALNSTAFDSSGQSVYHSRGEYLLIAQHRPHITQYVKQEDGSWSYSEVNDLSASLHLPSVDCALELSEVYRDVTFPAAPPPNIKEPADSTV